MRSVCSSAVLISLLIVVPAEAEASEAEASGTCLLAHKYKLFRGTTLSEASALYRAWNVKHTRIARAVNESTSELDKFIAAQAASGDACSSRLMEAKRALDGLAHEVISLSTQVESHQEVVKTETENLNITELSIKACGLEHDKATAACDELYAEAKKDLAQYTSELEELEQIAKPGARYEEAKEGHAASLIEVWSRESCLAFVKYQSRNKKLGVIQQHRKDTAPEDCDTQREDLQEAFSLSYNQVKKLKEDATDREADTTCQDTADAKMAAEKVPLVGQRETCTGLIDASNKAISNLLPVVELAKTQADDMRKHISATLAPECDKAAGVSETLTRVRDLIISLEECPGRNNFALKIPTE